MSIQHSSPSYSQLLNKGWFFKILSCKLSAIKEAYMSLKWLYKIWVSLAADTDPSSVGWAVGLDNKTETVPTTIISSTSFLSSHFLSYQSHNDAERKKSHQTDRKKLITIPWPTPPGSCVNCSIQSTQQPLQMVVMNYYPKLLTAKPKHIKVN